MRIGLDIDNVISDFDKKILEEFYKEDKNKRDKGIINPDGRWIKHQFDWTNDEIEEFFNKNMERFAQEFDLRFQVKKYMDKLLNDGHKLYLISNRCEPHYSRPYEITTNWLSDKGIKYTKLILSETTNKSKECLENNIDVMFDDVVKNCEQLIEANVKTYLMGTEYNKKFSNHLEIVNDWEELYMKVKNLEKKKVILDTDMYNEIDDQFALTYLIKSLDVFDLEAITIAPFLKSGYAKTTNIEDGINKSYDTTLKLLGLLNKDEYKEKVYKGSLRFLNDEPEDSEAVNKIIEIASNNEKTTIIAIGAITNIANAILKEPSIINKIKVVWLGGNSFLTEDNSEFNFRQDIKAVQTVFNSNVQLVVIPCRNVASNLSVTIYELEHYLSEDNEINNYLKEIFINCKKAFMHEKSDEIGSSKVLWDLSAVAYEINADWFKSKLISCPTILDNGLYEKTSNKHKVVFVNDLFRNKIMQDFYIKMGFKI